MANTYSKILLHFIVIVKYRRKLISEAIKKELEPYICEIVKSEKCLVYAIYCNPDHVHILIRMSPDKSPSEVMRKVKTESSRFINKRINPDIKFVWQIGYSTFSLREEGKDVVIRYILNQKEHHRKKDLEIEVKEMMKENDVEYEEKYLFDKEDNLNE